jgi:hypothetical protein|tara:strand:+ start:451 stop:1086 length:636 start_codon:yes stop_codon:yes gene_type:complete
MTGIIAQNVGRTSGLIKSAGGGGGTWTLIKTLTSDGSDSDLSFVDGTDDVTLDSTYPIYLFKFINIHPETDAKTFGFQGNAAGGSGYNETMTTTAHRAYHYESGADAGLGYLTASDQAEGTAFQDLMESDALGADNDQSLSGELWLFNPSSTTFVKHFMARSSMVHQVDVASDFYGGGYFNTTSAIDEIQFKMNSGEIQGGKIKLYGLSDS